MTSFHPAQKPERCKFHISSKVCLKKKKSWPNLTQQRHTHLLQLETACSRAIEAARYDLCQGHLT